MLKHPSGQKRVQGLASRFMKLRDEYQVAANAMWVGMLAGAFTDEELNLLADFLCPNDMRALKRVRQPSAPCGQPERLIRHS